MVGAVTVAASSPYFAFQLSKNISKGLKRKNYLSGKKRELEDSFSYMKRADYLSIDKQGKQIYISLTEKGKKRAGKYQLDDLKIKKQKEWDGLWRIVVFDIPDLTKIKREALRGKLKELGFQLFQRSVWIHPFDCKKEINLLKKFFGFKKQELTLIEGTIEHDENLRQIFKL